MSILFLGEEGAYESAAESGIRDGGSPIFFVPELPEPGRPYPEGLDAIIIPARRFLGLAPVYVPVPVLASGPPSLLAECLAAGCADYLREPWSLDELEARLARHSGAKAGWLEDGGSWDGKTLRGPGGQQILTPGLSTLFCLLLANRGTWVPREALAAILGPRATGSRSLDMQVSRLRGIFTKLELPLAAQALQSTSGGYRFNVPYT
jgi:CheY-like chemotaxis protein